MPVAASNLMNWDALADSAAVPGATIVEVSTQLVALALDANDPQLVAGFWSRALGRPMESGSEADFAVGSGEKLGLLIRRVPEPKVGKNSIHLDLSTTSEADQRSYVEQLLALGARHVDVGQTSDDKHVVLADPEGNEFCVLEPGNSFVDYSSRLGSITCDGSRDVGLFWSTTLGCPLVWDQDGETAVRAADGAGPFITWGPPVPDREHRNRLQFHVALTDGSAPQAEVRRMLSMGATHVDAGRVGSERWMTLADPDGNEFCLLTAGT
jgi:glyoxalase superfamily protein